MAAAAGGGGEGRPAQPAKGYFTSFSGEVEGILRIPSSAFSFVTRTEVEWPPYRIFALISVLCTVFSLILSGFHCFYMLDHSPPEIPAHLHHFLQILGYAFFINAVVTHRLYPFEISTRKVIHVTSHILCLTTLTIGIIFMAISKNTVKLSNGQYEPNLYSLHSFLAIGALSVYLLQFACGILALRDGVLAEIQRRVSCFHREIGIFLLTAMTVVASAGVQNSFNRRQCMSPYVKNVDVNPYKTYLGIPPHCQVLNAIGLLIYASALMASLATSKSDFKDIWAALTKPA